MKKMMLLGVFLLCVSFVVADDYGLDNSFVNDDVYLEKSSNPEDYYSFMQWDLSSVTSGKNVDPDSVEAYLNLFIIGGACDSVMDVYLLADQSINLTTDTVSSIYTQSKSVGTQYSFSSIAVGSEQVINVSGQVRQFISNPTNKYLTLRFESENNSVIPNFKNVGTDLKICGDTSDLIFASHDFPNVNYVPLLSVSFNETDYIPILPYEVVELPQLVSNVSLDVTGLTRTRLYCTWRVDNVGQEAVVMSSEVCPDVQQNYTFTDSEDYYVRIDYSMVNFSSVNQTWYLVEIGLAGELNQSYVMSYPEPPQSLWNSIYDTILNLVRSIICTIFPFLGFC